MSVTIDLEGRNDYQDIYFLIKYILTPKDMF